MSTIDHKPDCATTTTRTRTGARGDVLQTCTGCHRFVVLVPAPRPAPTPQRTPPAARVAPVAPVAPLALLRPVEALVAPVARYLCPEHLTPVSWRGRGCTECTRFLAEDARKRRDARRQAQS